MVKGIGERDRKNLTVIREDKDYIVKQDVNDFTCSRDG